MTYHRTQVVIVIPAARLAQANNYFAKHGYGENNFTRAIIRTADPDTQAARGYVAAWSTDAGLVALAAKIKQLDVDNVVVVIGRDARKRVRELLTDRGFRLKPQQET